MIIKRSEVGSNPFRPGAGHMPPYLAGRKEEELEFLRLLKQEIILDNMIITGLRGVGKTVLLETLKPIAIKEGWVVVGNELSESASVNEERLAVRIMADLASVTSGIEYTVSKPGAVGFLKAKEKITLGFATLRKVFDETPGLISDKLKAVLEFVNVSMHQLGKKGIVFAYDEAQNLDDKAEKEQYPLSLLLDIFQSIQKKNIPFLLVLTGLPTLLPKLVETRTYSERMFHVIHLDRLDEDDTREAILEPIIRSKWKTTFDEASVKTIIDLSGGYPYFIQFICKEVFDIWIQQIEAKEDTAVPVEEIIARLDSDFYAGRWALVTDRQKDLLIVIAKLPNCEGEFTVQEIVEKSKESIERPFGSSQVNQMLSSLGNAGLIYKDRHGRYRFAVPMFGQFIMRMIEEDLYRNR